ncbi:hypothetical protein BC830DRAFT_1082188, partial [Chytriomyces sp. MP71]
MPIKAPTKSTWKLHEKSGERVLPFYPWQWSPPPKTVLLLGNDIDHLSPPRPGLLLLVLGIQYVFIPVIRLHGAYSDYVYQYPLEMSNILRYTAFRIGYARYGAPASFTFNGLNSLTVIGTPQSHTRTFVDDVCPATAFLRAVAEDPPFLTPLGNVIRRSLVEEHRIQGPRT